MVVRPALVSKGMPSTTGRVRYYFSATGIGRLFTTRKVAGIAGGRVRRILGFGLLGIAALLLVLELMALADPVGTKLADDSDPFGDPHQPWWFHALWFAIVALLAAAGARLTRRGNVRRDRAPNATSR
jgi:hypothetical protein